MTDPAVATRDNLRGRLVPKFPQPRKPRCMTHHIWMAGCPDCAEQRHAEQEQAKQRLARP